MLKIDKSPENKLALWRLGLLERLKIPQSGHGLKALEKPAVNEPREAKLAQPVQVVCQVHHFGNGGLSLSWFQGRRVWVGKPFWAKSAFKSASRCASLTALLGSLLGSYQFSCLLIIRRAS